MKLTCPPDHDHAATWTCYKEHKCGCSDCRERNRAKGASYRARVATGDVDPWVRDLRALRKHVMNLRSKGMTVGQIKDRAGMSEKSVLFICNRRYKQVSRIVHDSLMGVQFTPKPTNDWDVIDGTGTRRRLQALTRMGWTGTDLMGRLGKSPSYSSHMLRSDVVERRTAKQVQDLYDELWDQTPPDTTGSRRAKLRAERNGWPPPLAWDDESIDNPDHEPDQGAEPRKRPPAERLEPAVVDAAINGERPPLSATERREVITFLNERYWSADRIAEHIDCNPRTVDRIRKELNLPIYLAGGERNQEKAA